MFFFCFLTHFVCCNVMQCDAGTVCRWWRKHHQYPGGGEWPTLLKSLSEYWPNIDTQSHSLCIYTCTEYTITHVPTQKNTENSLCYTSCTKHRHITVMIRHKNKNTEIHRYSSEQQKGFESCISVFGIWGCSHITSAKIGGSKTPLPPRQQWSAFG